MARGKSGRVVLEIDPNLKRNLYLELEKRQQTLKEWFVAEAKHMVYGEEQASLNTTTPELVDKPPKKRSSK